MAEEKINIEPFLKETFNMDLFNRVFETIRLVDPLEKKVLYFKDGLLENLDEICYGFWDQRKVCQNCISMQAIYQQDSMVKIEHLENRAYLIMAVPLKMAGRDVVLEMLKDMTNSISAADARDVHSELRSMINSLNKLATKDGLTGVYNKRYLNDRLPVDMTNSRHWPISLIMTDLDHFKAVNDQYGHLAGDEALKAFAEILEENNRKDKDWVARFGGEEFLICLTNTHGSEAKRVAERMRKSLAEKVFRHGEYQYGVTASFGVCSYDGSMPMTPSEFIQCSDHKLLEAKRLGRNIVIF